VGQSLKHSATPAKTMFEYFASISPSGQVELIASLKILRLEFIIKEQYRRDF
jgi:competence CoiA-like predicted nuclease